jgi:hypothetical protein
MRRRREDPASPPAAFPVHGLDGWPGARWLDGFGDAIGEQVRWVRLAHQDTRTGVDGAAVAARVWRFADGWAAVSEAVAGVTSPRRASDRFRLMTWNSPRCEMAGVRTGPPARQRCCAKSAEIFAGEG